MILGVILKRPIKRVYFPWWQWEEVDANMWGSVSDRKKFLKLAIEFTGDYKLYGRWMIKVVEKWPISCAHNLSNTTQNRKAWIGHAACALAHGIPEDIVRQAWAQLSEDQQRLANKKADEAIEYWEEEYGEKLCQSAV